MAEGWPFVPETRIPNPETRRIPLMSDRHNHPKLVRRLCWPILVAGFALMFVVQTQVDLERGTYAQIADVLYIPNATILRRLALGNEGLLADIYWTRVVQYFGRKHLEPTEGVYKYKLLAPLLRITTDLDPHLLIAYRFGAIFLMAKPPEGAGQPEAALQFLRRGIVANPDYWRLWQDLGFVYYWELKDYKMAAKIFEVGSERPDAEYWMKALAGTVAAKAGDIQTSRFLWSEIYRHAETDDVRRTAEEHLAALAAAEEIGKLNQLLSVYQQKAGREAHWFYELYALGLLRGVPRDPSGEPFVILPDGRAGLGPNSRVNMRLLE